MIRSSSILLKKEKHSLLMGLFVAILATFGVQYKFLTVIGLVLSLAVLVINSEEQVLYFMLFLMPFAGLFKFSEHSSSIFTYLELLFIVRLILPQKHNLSARLVVTYGLFFSYILAGCINSELSVFLKQAIIPLIIICSRLHSKPRLKALVTIYSISLIIASLVGKYFNFLPNLSNYVLYERAYDVTNLAYRFSGLYSDPNYYSASIIIILSCLFVLYINQEIELEMFFLSVPLVFFGMQTISKSFYLMLGIISVLTIYYLCKKRRYLLSLIYIICVMISAIYILQGNSNSFNMIFERFQNDSSITTGRAVIWGRYIDLFFSNPFRTLVGWGAGAPFYNNHAAHNTYIDFIYYYGIFGTIFFWTICLNITNGINDNSNKKGTLFPLISFSLMAFFLSYIKFFDFPFILYLVIYVLLDYKKEELCSDMIENKI